MSEYSTDSPDFTDSVVALPDRYADRLSESDLSWLRDTAQAGEWAEALESLVLGLIQQGSLVTRDERDELAKLYRIVGIDTDLLKDLTVQG